MQAKCNSETSRALALELTGVFSAANEGGQIGIFSKRTSNSSLLAWAAGDGAVLLCA